MTVVDYKDAEKLHAERSAKCQQAKGEGDACMNSWRNDVAGAVVGPPGSSCSETPR